MDQIAQPGFWMYIFGFLLLLGPLVTIHELGHYLVGRWFGVKADAFSIGFGKEIAGWTDKRGTRWKLAALPLGGYVQFAGDMNPASQPDADWLKLPADERNRCFQAKPLWQRALIVLAGPLANFLFAIAILAGFNLVYGKSVAIAEVVGFEQGSAAQAAGLQVRDRIVAIDGREVMNFADVLRLTAPYPDQTVKVAVLRGAERLELPVKLSREEDSDRFGNKAAVGDIGIDFLKPMVGSFAQGSPAEVAGIRKGDLIRQVDDRQVSSFSEVAAYVRPRLGATVSVMVEREGALQRYRVKLAQSEAPGADGKPTRVAMLGIGPSIGTIEDVGPGEAVVSAVDQCFGIVRMMITGIGQIVTGQRSVDELGGPIKIAKFSGEQLTLGWRDFVAFAAFISINLGFINLLPIPVLDGGHLAFYAAEAIRRKPASPKSQEWAFRTGIAFVVALMLFVTINDLASLKVFGG